MINKTYSSLLIFIVALGAASTLAMSESAAQTPIKAAQESQDTAKSGPTIDVQKTIIAQWIKRGEEARKKHQTLMALKTKTAKQECEILAERAYSTAGILLLSQKDDKAVLQKPIGLLIGASLEKGVIINFNYALRDQIKNKVQLVEVMGDLLNNENKVVFGGELAPKGLFMVKVGKCVYSMNEAKPLEYENLTR